jgi:hypothetical protein
LPTAGAFLTDPTRSDKGKLSDLCDSLGLGVVRGLNETSGEASDETSRGAAGSRPSRPG